MYKSTFMGLNTALRGVLAHQNALDVTGHNISNVNTNGYTRQRAELSTTAPWSSPSLMSQTTPGQMGTGVEVLRIERLRDRYIDQNVRQQFGRQSMSQTMVDQLDQVESAFNEPGDLGISKLMSKFFDSITAVGNNPADPGTRATFAQNVDALANGLRQTAADLTTIAAQSNTRLNDTVTTVNGISQQIASLNTEISLALQHNQQPNDLLDQRDRLMDDLSKVVNYTWTEAATGEVTITMGTTTPIALVDPLVAGGFTAIVRADLDTAYGNGDLTSGSAFADEELNNTTIPAYMTALDNIAGELVLSVNAAHSTGSFDLNGNAGGNVFDPLMTTAASIRLDPANNILTNPRLVAAASSWGGGGEPSNGSIFLNAMAALRTAPNASMGGATFQGYYTGTITGLGAQASGFQNSLSNADVLVDMAVARRDQVSGVSMDEEMSNMLRFQNSYNASARVLTTMDDAIDTIINRMGRVGL